MADAYCRSEQFVADTELVTDLNAFPAGLLNPQPPILVQYTHGLLSINTSEHEDSIDADEDVILSLREDPPSMETHETLPTNTLNHTNSLQVPVDADPHIRMTKSSAVSQQATPGEPDPHAGYDSLESNLHPPSSTTLLPSGKEPGSEYVPLPVSKLSSLASNSTDDTQTVPASPQMSLNVHNSQNSSRPTPRAFSSQAPDLLIQSTDPPSPTSSMPSSSPAKLFSSPPLPSSQSSGVSHTSHPDEFIIDQLDDLEHMVSPRMHCSPALQEPSSPDPSPSINMVLSSSPPPFHIPSLPSEYRIEHTIENDVFNVTSTFEPENMLSNITSYSLLPSNPHCIPSPAPSMNNNVHTDNSLRPICVSPSVCAEGQHDFAGETKIDASDTFSSPDTRASLDYIPALPLSSSKRSREESEAPTLRQIHSGTYDGEDKNGEDHETPLAKRSKKAASPSPFLPAPKRPTAASQRIQQKKLSTPFRSPLVKTTTGIPSGIDRHAVGLRPERTLDLMVGTQTTKTDPQPPEGSLVAAAAPSGSAETHMTKARTKRAAKQFKSPLSADSSSAVISSVRLTPTIQMLKRKVQVLKRAIKVKNDGDEKTLEKLVEKWTEAGREVAYGVWELVKDMGGDDTRARGSGGWGSDEWDGKGKGRNFKDSWGWNDKAERRGAVNETERNWGWVVSVDEKVDDGAGEDRSMEDSRGGSADKRWEKEGGPEEDEKRDTLGTMLKQLGIDPQTLGWDDEEGTFSGE